jgi:dolichol-phosphate mannosyltransferase
MRASILLGSITSIGSFTYGTIVIVAALLDGNPVPGFATLVTLMTFLLGIVFVNLGILSEYVWLIFLELNKQPTYVIDREFNTDV